MNGNGTNRAAMSQAANIVYLAQEKVNGQLLATTNGTVMHYRLRGEEPTALRKVGDAIKALCGHTVSLPGDEHLNPETCAECAKVYDAMVAKVGAEIAREYWRTWTAGVERSSEPVRKPTRKLKHEQLALPEAFLPTGTGWTIDTLGAGLARPEQPEQARWSIPMHHREEA